MARQKCIGDNRFRTSYITGREAKQLKGCVFSSPSLLPVPGRGKEARKRNLSIASNPVSVVSQFFQGNRAKLWLQKRTVNRSPVLQAKSWTYRQAFMFLTINRAIVTMQYYRMGPAKIWINKRAELLSVERLRGRHCVCINSRTCRGSFTIFESPASPFLTWPELKHPWVSVLCTYHGILSLYRPFFAPDACACAINFHLPIA